MKAERRHDLKTNALAAKLYALPDAWRKLVGRTILFVGLAVAASILVATWRNRSIEKTLRLNDDLASAYDRINELKGFPSNRINSSYNEAQELLKEIATDSTDPKLLAQAKVAEGDLNWAVATAYWCSDGRPVQSGADEDFELQPSHSRHNLLDAAASGYKTVIDKYPEQKLAVIQAHFGAAAIDEDLAGNRGTDKATSAKGWEAAMGQYASVIQIAGDTPEFQFYKLMAGSRLASLNQLSIPVLLGTPQEPSPATTQSATTQSTTTQSAATQSTTTQSSTLPTAPATRPTAAARRPPATRPTTRP